MHPLTLYQDRLNLVSDAILAGDFASYAEMIDLPYLIHTATADLLVSTREALRPTFDALSQGLRKRGVTHYERVARSADYVARDRIAGWHHTHMIRKGERIAYPQLSRHMLVRRDNRWLVSEAHYAANTAAHWPMTEEDLFAHVDALAAARVLR